MEKTFSPEAANQIFYRCVEDCFEPIMITDRNGLLRYVNPAWSLVYGYSREEAIGQTPRLLRSKTQRDDFYKSMWATILDAKIGFWRGEVLNRAKDGHLVPVLLTITPYREPTGEIVGYMGIAVDLTEQKKMEHQILQQDRLASIGLLAGGLAHEIGNPLGTIQGRAELLLESTRGNLAAEKNVSIIISQIDRIAKLLKSLLRVSRVPETVQLKPVELESAVNEVALLVAEPLRKLQIDFKVAGLKTFILAEPHQLQQLFLNLVINAMHAIEEQKLNGPPSKHSIEISATSANEECIIQVRDTGCGISPANRAKVFQPFFTTKAAGQGTGLGLAVTSKLVEEMHGTIGVFSDGVGHGAMFEIKLKTGTPEKTK